MTLQAKLVIGPARLRVLAEQWSSYGLLGEFAWLDSETAGGGLPLVEWQAIEATVLRPGRQTERARLQEYLSRLDDVESALMLWTRQAAEDHAEGLRSADTFLLQVFPGNLPRVRIDLIEPADFGDRQLPKRVQGWPQYLIATQDNPELSNADSGWTQTRDAVAVHSIAALAGVLGGEASVSPDRPTPAPRFVHAFSRHVGGGRIALDEARRYVDDELPVFDAVDVDPHHFGRPLRPERELERCLEWIRNYRERSLRYTPPAPIPLADLGADEQFRYAGFDLALQQLILPTPIEAIRRRHDRIEQLRSEIDARLDELRYEEGDRPAGEVWEAVFQLTTGIIDGGDVPQGFERTVRLEREFVLAPEHVEPDPDLQQYFYPDALFDVFPQLQSSPPLLIGRSAFARARSTLEQGPPPVAGTGATSPAGIFAAPLTGLDETIRTEQAKELGDVRFDDYVGDGQTGDGAAAESEPPESAPEPTRFVDRLFRDILGDALVAWWDGKRLHRLATSPWDITLGLPTWRARIAVLVGIAIAVAGALVWHESKNDINVQLVQGGAEPIPVALGYAVPIAVGMAIAVLAVALLAAAIRRRLTAAALDQQIRLQLETRAAAAYRAAQRLDHAVRIMGYWWRIFRELYRPLSSEELSPAPARPPLPASLQWGEPTIHENFRPLLVATAATDVGWRGKAVRDLAATSLAKYRDVPYHTQADDALFADLGMPEGALHRFARDLETGLIRQEWRDALIASISEGIRDELVLAETRVDSPTGQTVREFLDELVGESGVIPGVYQVQGRHFAPSVESRYLATGNTRDYFSANPLTPVHATWTTGAAAARVMLADLPETRSRHSGETTAAEPAAAEADADEADADDDR